MLLGTARPLGGETLIARLALCLREANSLIETWAESQMDLVYVDLATPMLGGDGTPRVELFADDGLHMSEEGYALWDSVLRSHLTSVCQETASQ